MSPSLDQIKGQVTVGAYRAGGLAARWTPPVVGHRLMTALGMGAAVVSPERRAIVEKNLDRIHGRTLSRFERSALVNQTFDSYARYYYDSLRLPTMSRAAIDRGFTVEGLEHLEAVMAADGPGPVLALPHLGGWEWAAAWITRVRGWGLSAVVEPLEPPELFEWFLEFRRSLGMEIIPLGPDAAGRVAASAARKQVVCLLSDRDLGGNGVPVEFFGEMTTLPAGPAVLGIRGGCAILPTAVYFTPDGVHGVVRPPLPTDRRGRVRDDVGRITQDLARELEVLIRQAPEQWHLMQPNWPSDRTRAAGSPDDRRDEAR